MYFLFYFMKSIQKYVLTVQYNFYYYSVGVSGRSVFFSFNLNNITANWKNHRNSSTSSKHINYPIVSEHKSDTKIPHRDFTYYIHTQLLYIKQRLFLIRYNVLIIANELRFFKLLFFLIQWFEMGGYVNAHLVDP